MESKLEISSSSSSSGFFILCILHSMIALICGFSIMFCPYEISSFGHGSETARKLLGFGLNPHDQLLIQISDSFVGLLLFVIGFLLFMVAFIKDEDFQSFFAKGCIVLHFAMGLWRVKFERRLEDLANDWPRQLVGDFVLALSWVFFLVYSWNEKYDQNLDHEKDSLYLEKIFHILNNIIQQVLDETSIWASPIRECNNLGIFLFFGYFSILINAQKIEILLHARIGPAQIMRPSRPSLCEYNILVFYKFSNETISR